MFTKIAELGMESTSQHYLNTNISTYVQWRLQDASTSQVIGARNEMIMDDYDGQMMFGDLVGLKIPDIRMTGEEKPRKKPHSGNLSRPGMEPGPAAWPARMLPLVPQRYGVSNRRVQAYLFVDSHITPFKSIKFISLRDYSNIVFVLIHTQATVSISPVDIVY